MDRKRLPFNRAFKAKAALVAGLFGEGRRRGGEPAPNHESLYAQIGRLQMEVEWLRKNRPSTPEELRRSIEPKHSVLCVFQQCKLLGLPRSTYYHQPVGETPEKPACMWRRLRWGGTSVLTTGSSGTSRAATGRHGRGTG